VYDRIKAYFLSVWRGQRSLAETFWLWTVGVVWGVIYIGGSFVAVTVSRGLKTEEPYIWYLGAIIIGTIWSTVGLWRSASRSGSLWSILARLAQLLVVSGLLFLFARALKLV